MDIFVQVTGQSGITRKLEIRKAAQGTELVVLEQFLGGAVDTSRMIAEATDDYTEPDTRDPVQEFQIELATSAGETFLSQRASRTDSLAELAANVEQQLQEARRSRMNINPIRQGESREKEQASRRIQRMKKERAQAVLNETVADCLAELSKKIQHAANKAF